jgi:hypothetical protein
MNWLEGSERKEAHRGKLLHGGVVRSVGNRLGWLERVVDAPNG